MSLGMNRIYTHMHKNIFASVCNSIQLKVEIDIKPIPPGDDNQWPVVFCLR